MVYNMFSGFTALCETVVAPNGTLQQQELPAWTWRGSRDYKRSWFGSCQGFVLPHAKAEAAKHHRLQIPPTFQVLLAQQLNSWYFMFACFSLGLYTGPVMSEYVGRPPAVLLLSHSSSSTFVVALG